MTTAIRQDATHRSTTRVARGLLGWLPGTVVWIAVVVLLRARSGVPVGDSVAYSAFVLGFLVVPGTLAWRWLFRERRPLAEDLVLGTVLGAALGVPAYLLLTTLDVPHLVWLWPVAAVLLAVGPPRSRRIVLRPSGPALPGPVSWSLGAIVGYAMVWLAMRVWPSRAVTLDGLARPYIDDPFHLSLVGEFRHHFPAQIPYVDGTALDYHWVTYPHLASATWATGVEASSVLRVLGMTAVVVITILAAGFVAARLSGQVWAAPVMAGLLVLVTPLDVFGWTDPTAPWAGSRYLGGLLYLSPTQTFATLVFALVLVITVEVLRAEESRLVPLRAWMVLGFLMLVVGGAKATFLPGVIAGLGGALVLGLVIERRLRGTTTVVTLGLSVGMFLLARVVFYGPGARSLTWSPLAAIGAQVESWGLPPSPVVLGTVVATYVIAHLAAAVGVVGLLVRSGWRSPVPQFLAGTYAASAGAALLLDHPAGGQLYFLAAGTLTLLLLSTLGLVALVDSREEHLAVVLASGLLAGAVLTGVVTTLTPESPFEGGEPAGRLLWFALPPLAVLALALLPVLLAKVRPFRRWSRGRLTVFALATVIGLGLGRTTAELGPMATARWSAVGPEVEPPLLIGPGGVEAARWVREHSTPADLVATNAHCRLPSEEPRRCTSRHFWISGLTERHVLVEGWAYIDRPVTGTSGSAEVDTVSGDFWDPDRLADNDRAFTDPTAGRLGALSADYGVDFLFVDLAYPHRVQALSRLADLRYRDGRYAVLELRD